jgi:hypothetical protein
MESEAYKIWRASSRNFLPLLLLQAAEHYSRGTECYVSSATAADAPAMLKDVPNLFKDYGK